VKCLERLLKSVGVSLVDFFVTFGALTGRRGVEVLQRLCKKWRGFSG
jgi:hypothetical protein